MAAGGIPSIAAVPKPNCCSPPGLQNSMTHHSLPAHRSTATWAADAFLPMARSTVIPIWWWCGLQSTLLVRMRWLIAQSSMEGATFQQVLIDRLSTVCQLTLQKPRSAPPALQGGRTRAATGGREGARGNCCWFVYLHTYRQRSSVGFDVPSGMSCPFVGRGCGRESVPGWSVVGPNANSRVRIAGLQKSIDLLI